ncbi:MAG: C40 family peptidase [Acetobacteraceae bacterium]|nr:C40 family peptidase [Acetobacteraceae bacterium]
MPTRAEILKIAREYQGTPYRHRGASLDGIDCANFIVQVGKRAGCLPASLELPLYNPRPDPELFELVLAYGDPIPLSEARPGDVLVLCHPERGPAPQHLAIKTDDGMIQVFPGLSIRKVCEHNIDAEWEEAIIGAYRFRGVTD